MRRRLFQWFTVVVLIVCVWTVYENVLSDDMDVRAKARVTADDAAGCGDNCKIEGLRGERGMLSEEIEYDILNHGTYVINCSRAFIIAGNYTCIVKSGKLAPSASASSTASASPSASTKR